MTQSMLRVLVVVWLLLPAGGAGGQPIDPPLGLYCSCPPTTDRSNSVLPDVAVLDFVDGFLVRVEWGAMEPAPGTYDWTLLDGQLASAATFGKRVSLAVVNGPRAPAWLSAQGVEMFSYEWQGATSTIPVPWDQAYLERWLGFVERLGERYADDERISLVYITTSSSNGFEMQLPSFPADQTNWQSIGYTADLLVDAWERTIDAFAAAFPRHALSHEVHPVLGSDEVASRVVAYADGDGRFFGRVGVLAAWWMEHNAIDVYPGMFEIIKDASFRSGSQVQVANSFTMRPERFGPDGLGGVLGLALDSGVRYAEVWNSDLLNTALHADLGAYAARLRVPLADVNGDGLEDIEDLHAAHRETPDLNGDGVGDGADLAIVQRRLRAREIEAVAGPRP